MKCKPLPQVEFLRECLTYEDGHLIWLARPPQHFKTARQWKVWNRLWSGKIAGSPMKNVYRLVGIDKAKFLEHRLIYRMMVGPLDDTQDIDHIDHDRTNNRPENLRLCSRAQNSMNQPGRASRQYPGLPKHVHWSANEGKYKVQMRANGRVHFIGTFSDLDEATKAAEEARERLHGEYANSDRRAA